MMTEIWRDIPGYEGIYQVSDLGRVRRLPDERRRAVRVLRPYLDDWGYARVGLKVDRCRKQYRVHQLVVLAFIGKPPVGLEIRHLDGDKGNNTLSNLAYGTSSQNKYDTVRHGMHRRAGGGHYHRRYQEARVAS